MATNTRPEELHRSPSHPYRRSSLGMYRSPISDAVKHAGSIDHRLSNVDQLSRTLHQQFANETRGIARTRTHRDVAVLLLSWQKVSDAHMDVSEEVNDLELVFRDHYGFKVYTELFKPGAPRHQVNRHLANFLCEEDRKDTLLIIYYAGHGIQGDGSETLTLLGGNPSPGEEHLTQFVWNEAEQMLHKVEADLLLIFDCCHAGILAREKREPRDIPSIFEFIGSTQGDKTAVGPGDDSFTSALIHALKELASAEDGFTTMQLFNKIKDAPYFCSIGQEPVTSERSKIPSYKRLKIMPLRKKSQEQQRPTSGSFDTSEESVCCFLRLNFRFTRLPDEADISTLTQSLCQLAKKDFPIQQVEWEGLTESAPLTFGEIASAKKTVNKWWRRRKSRASINSVPIIDNDDFFGPGVESPLPTDAVASQPKLEERDLALLESVESMKSRIEHIDQSTTTTLNSILVFRSQRKVLVTASLVVALSLVINPRSRNLLTALFM